MNLNEKIRKLANAVKAYRGISDHRPDSSGKIHWRTTPKPASQPQVVKWIEKLGLDPEKTMDQVHGFKNLQEFDEWLKALHDGLRPKTAQERGL